MRDLRYAARQLLRARGFAAVAVVTLGLGIGACVAIFSAVDGVLLRPLPYPEAEQLVVLRESWPPRFPDFVVRAGTFRDWQQHATSFDALAAVRAAGYNLTGTGEPVRVSAARITANTFATLGVQPARGRDFTAEEDVPGKGNVVILSDPFWRRQLGGRLDVLGQSIQLDGQAFTVVGVMPAGFTLDTPVDLFTPAAYFGDPRMRTTHSIEVIGRLRAGVSLAAARSQMAVVTARLAAAPEYRGWGFRLMPMLEWKVANVRPVLFSLLGAVGLLLFIACANVANLLLARGTARAKEIAVRAALGASRGRIVRQLLAESLLLALLGGALGVLFAHGGMSVLLAVAPESLPRASGIGVDGRALAFAVALVLVTAVGFGLAPALRATRIDLNRTLKESGRGAGEGSHHQRVRAALAAGQIALALVLLTSAALLIRSFLRLQTVDRGFRPEGVLAVELSLSRGQSALDPRWASFAERAESRLAALPGVEAAGAAQVLPFSVNLNMIHFSRAGRPDPVPAPITYIYFITPGYLRAMGIPLLRGRAFDHRDVAGSPPVALINQSMARKHFAGEDPIGKRIGPPDDPGRGEIVGVVGDVKDDKLESDVTMQTYVPLAQFPIESLTFVVRSAGAPPAPAALREAIYAVDRNQPIASVRPMSELLARSTARQRFAALLFAVFSGCALVLAATGVYGVMAYAVAQRRAEIGIRMALGAQPRDVLRLMLLRGGRVIGAGLAVGLIGAAALTRLLGSMLFGVSPGDPLSFAAIALLLAAVAVAAALLPARRATRIDPLSALRAE